MLSGWATPQATSGDVEANRKVPRMKRINTETGVIEESTFGIVWTPVTND